MCAGELGFVNLTLAELEGCCAGDEFVNLTTTRLESCPSGATSTRIVGAAAAIALTAFLLA
jgi:hypothetical protein